MFSGKASFTVHTVKIGYRSDRKLAVTFKLIVNSCEIMLDQLPCGPTKNRKRFWFSLPNYVVNTFLLNYLHLHNMYIVHMVSHISIFCRFWFCFNPISEHFFLLKYLLLRNNVIYFHILAGSPAFFKKIGGT